MLESLDFVYVPTVDVDAAATHHVQALGAVPLWRVRAADTTVTALQVSRIGPPILLTGHLDGERPVLVNRVADYQQSVTALRTTGQLEIRELELPTARARRSASTAASATPSTN